ncbi:hypothetical protein Dimus_003348 [Dionaea muscipula]
MGSVSMSVSGVVQRPPRPPINRGKAPARKETFGEGPSALRVVPARREMVGEGPSAPRTDPHDDELEHFRRYMVEREYLAEQGRRSEDIPSEVIASHMEHREPRVREAVAETPVARSVLAARGAAPMMREAAMPQVLCPRFVKSLGLAKGLLHAYYRGEEWHTKPKPGI